DSEKQDSLAGDLHQLGIRNLFPISAEHGRGIDDLLDAIFETLKLETAAPETPTPRVPHPSPKGRVRISSAEPEVSTSHGESTEDEASRTDVPTTNDQQPTAEVKVA